MYDDKTEGFSERRTSKRRKTKQFLKAFFLAPAARPITARTLVKLILASLKLHPVALAAQFAGIIAFAVMFQQSDVNAVFLTVWCVFGLAHFYFSLHFVRLFWRDRDRVARVRVWIRRWMVLAVSAGIIWGVAGAAFIVPVKGIEQVVTVAVIVAVTFASWPVYSCWMPSLTAFTLLSLTPLTISVAAQYGVSQTAMALVIIAVTVFILYSGRKLNEMVLSSILTDAENRRLVERLKTEINRAESARRATEAVSEQRARFFAAANHDLRQPLQAMGICLDILKRRATPETAPIIAHLTSTSNSISTLVEQVLEVTRMEFGKLELHVEQVDLTALLEEFEQEFGPVAREKGIRFRIRPIPVTVSTDPQLLRRALRNLVSNAIRYTDETRPNAEVVLALRRRGTSRVEIGVYDAGPGLSREDKARIFDTFYRGSAGKARPGTGFGLGLSIVKGICRELGITLSVGSHLGRGSVFRLCLEVSEAEQVRLCSQKVVRAAAVGRLSGPIALVEDNAFVREALGSTLESLGAEVLAYELPDDEACRKLASIENLRLLSDYNLGDDRPTGLDIAGRIEKLKGTRLPAVVLTAVARDLIEARFERPEAGDTMPATLPRILQKPASVEAIVNALNAVSAPSTDTTDRTESSDSKAAPEPVANDSTSASEPQS